MDTTTAESTQRLAEILAQFQQENPLIIEALQVMNISFDEYLRALATMRETGSTSGNALTAQ